MFHRKTKLHRKLKVKFFDARKKFAQKLMATVALTKLISASGINSKMCAVCAIFKPRKGLNYTSNCCLVRTEKHSGSEVTLERRDRFWKSTLQLLNYPRWNFRLLVVMAATRNLGGCWNFWDGHTPTPLNSHSYSMNNKQNCQFKSSLTTFNTSANLLITTSLFFALLAF